MTLPPMLYQRSPDAERNRLLAQALIQQGGDTSPIQSPWQALARVVQGGLGGWMKSQADEAEKTKQAGYQQALAKALAAGQGVVPWVNPDTQMTAPGTTPTDAMVKSLSASGNPDVLPMAQYLMMGQMERQGQEASQIAGERRTDMREDRRYTRNRTDTLADRTADRAYEAGVRKEDRAFTEAQTNRQLSAAERRAREERDFQLRTSLDKQIADAMSSGDMGQIARLTAAKQAIDTKAAGKGFEQADKLRDEFVKGAGDFVKVRDAYGRIIASAKDPSPAGDLSLIFNYMKVLDPGSTVREGEFATAQNATGVPEQVRNYFNKVISGERLGDAQRIDFVNRADMLYRQQEKFQQQNVSRYTDLAKAFGLDPANVVSDMRGDFYGGASAGAPKASVPGATPIPVPGVPGEAMSAPVPATQPLPGGGMTGDLPPPLPPQTKASAGATRYVNPKTGEMIEWNGSAYVPVK